MSPIEGKYIPEPNSGCWLWLGEYTNKGYGAVSFEGKRWMAHRLAWVIENGPIQDGMFACHKCDNPACINPSHIFIGTPGDNMRDCVRKGRHARQKNPELHPSHKFSDGTVKHIREVVIKGDPERGYGALARKYGVDTTCIRDIAMGKSYRHVSPKMAVRSVAEKPIRKPRQKLISPDGRNWTEIARENGISKLCFRGRIRIGWDAERAATQPQSVFRSGKPVASSWGRA